MEPRFHSLEISAPFGSAPFAVRVAYDLRNAPWATGSRGGGEETTFPPPSNRKARVGRPRWGRDPGPALVRWLAWGAGEEDARGFLLSLSPARCWKGTQ